VSANWKSGARRASRRGRAVGVVAVVLLTVALVAAGPAGAEKVREYTGVSFGPDGVGGAEGFSDLQSIAVDPASEDVLAYDAGAQAIYKFDAAGHPVDFSALGASAIEGVGGFVEPGARQVAVAPPGSPAGTAGDIYVANSLTVKVYSPGGVEIGSLGEGETCGVAVSPAGSVFVGSYPSAVREYLPTANPPTDADKVGEAEASIELCDLAADGAGQIFAANFLGERLARLEGIGDATPTIVEPGGSTIAAGPGEGDLYVDGGDHVAVFDPSGAAAYEFGSGQLESSYGLAVGNAEERVYVADGGSGRIKVFGDALTPPTTEAATGVTAEAATLHGLVFPEGHQLADCRFEYGLAAAAGFEGTGACEPDAGQIPADGLSHRVSLSIGGLRPDSEYRFRLVTASSAGSAGGETLTFSTVGPPRVTEVISRADRTSARLEATVDPRGAATTYRIEWGPTASLGRVATTGSVSAEDGPTKIDASLVGLDPAATYRYRIVAESSAGVTASPGQTVETLNSCGLTDGRCFERVSLADKGPLASPGRRFRFGAQIQFLAAASGSALAYTVYPGYPDATAGDAALYLSHRSTDGWSSEQLTPPNDVDPARGSNGSMFETLSSELGCGVVASRATLVPGAPRLPVEQGGTNLYVRDNATSSYRLITNLPPAGSSLDQIAAAVYEVIGVSPDCRRVVFRTPSRYPGVAVVGGGSQLYEWDDGALRNVAVVAGPGGTPVPVESLPGAMDEAPGNGVPLGEKTTTNFRRAVSVDASRTIFTAFSEAGADSGNRAVFLRDGDDPAVADGSVPATDISQSETATANDGSSRYWVASEDAERIFFTARFGLALNGSSVGATSCADVPHGGIAEGSGEGCDLYEYDAGSPAGERLTDLSVDTDDRRGAGVVGVLDASEDGSYVYFAARGRLGGAGRTEAENLRAATYNVYLAHAGEISFVHLLGQAEALAGKALVDTIEADPDGWTSRASTDGGEFAFETSVGIPGEVSMAYLYSAADRTVVCVSCRPGGAPPFSAAHLTPLVTATQKDPNARVVQPVTLTGNGHLFFYSFDPLAPGAVEGDRNLYQWEHGQVSLVATEPPGVPRAGDGTPNESFFAGASGDAGDIYLATTQALTSTDDDGRWDVYDARVGGGLPEPSPPTPPCDSTAEGACSSSAAAAGQAADSTATSSFVGPANPKAKKPPCPMGKRAVKKHGKPRCVKRSHHKKPKHRKKAKHHRGAKK
jgi:hypothetical protein